MIADPSVGRTPRRAIRAARLAGALVLLLAGPALSAPAARAKSTGATPHAAPARRAPAVHRASPPEYPLYQELLDDHLWITSEAGEPLETRFNYEKYYDEPGRAERSFRIRQQFLDVDPAAMDVKHRHAWAINFYNFLVVDQITDQLLMPGKKRQRWTSVQEIKPEGEEFFRHPLVTVDSTRYSLDDFERHFVFEGFDRQPGHAPPATLDPRAHFALVCGAVGCPPLQKRAYRSDSLDVQLDHAVRSALASPLQWNPSPDGSVVRMSAIFFWYAPDFGGLPNVLSWALPWVPKSKRAGIDPKKPPATAQITWDWKLNQVSGWRFYEEMQHRPPGVPHDH